MNNFEHLGLSGEILQALTSEGYENPTPIQAKVIPAMLSGRDIVGIAQTGTGKTAAFVLPLLQQLLDNFSKPQGKNCSALIMAPTRELAAQITQSIRTYGQFMRFSTTLIVGGAKYPAQIKALARGVDIVVATPGRLEDHIKSGHLRLDHTTAIVLDEADQMMDMGFIPAIRRIMAHMPRSRQTMLLSATMPKQIRSLANDFLNNPMEISVAPQARPIERIDQKIFFIDKGAKRQALKEILAGPDVTRTIVFTRTKYGADGVKTHLEKAGFSVVTIHGNRSQRQRESAMKTFRAGRVEVLVATDVAARGIDVDDISHIINFELPNVPESYVHRIGRTARAGKGGMAISLCDGSERKFLRDIERVIGQNLDKSKFVHGAPPVAAPKPEFDIAPPTLGRQSHKRPDNQKRTNNSQSKPFNNQAKPNDWKKKTKRWEGASQPKKDHADSKSWQGEAKKRHGGAKNWHGEPKKAYGTQKNTHGEAKPESREAKPNSWKKKAKRWDPLPQETEAKNHQGEAKPKTDGDKSKRWEGKKSQNKHGKPFKHYGKKKGGGGWTGANPKNRNRNKAA